MAEGVWKGDIELRWKGGCFMGRIWPYAWAFAIMCIIYTVCKILGLEWAAERAWLEVLLFDVVAVGIITSFFMRRKIVALYYRIKNKLS